jgi:hypothetical protein
MTNQTTTKPNPPSVKRGPESFDAYYSSILSSTSFSSLKSFINTPLPLTFRISNLLTPQQRQKLTTQIAQFATPVQHLECYTFPNITKTTLKKEENHKALHRFLIAMTEAGYVTRQENVSMMPSTVLQVKKNMNVLDMCAAPGMKTSQIVENCGQLGGKTTILVYTTILQYYDTTILQYYYTTILQYYYTTILQYHNTTILQYYNDSTLVHYNTSTIVHYNTSTIVHYNTSTIVQ